MDTQFFSRLSQNYVGLLEDDEYYDVTIEVGEDPNVKIFRAHMNILCYRSPYLRRTLVSNKKNKDNVLVHTKLPNIIPKTFQVILKYIYGGILSLNDQDTSDILKVLIAANELFLQELVDYLQNYLIKNKSEWMEQHFELTHQTSFQSNNLLELQQFCTNLMVNSPEKLFKSFDFTSLSENSLVQLIKRDDLQMKEIEVWEHVLKWGLAKNPTIISDPVTWTDNDFKTMENTIQHCLPSIRFFSLSSKEFLNKVRPYKKLLKHQIYEDLVNSYMDPDSNPNENILPPRNIKHDGIIDSKIVNLNIVSTISRWIDKIDRKSRWVYPKKIS
uniref:BTB domain-containing protein n=1 Tax=Rhizophagus irregularis (strain DAOM 181602 / DAOM 197198 / MUCL 43194) TaxID=747089 RepID=U9TLX7_RHIID